MSINCDIDDVKSYKTPSPSPVPSDDKSSLSISSKKSSKAKLKPEPAPSTVRSRTSATPSITDTDSLRDIPPDEPTILRTPSVESEVSYDLVENPIRRKKSTNSVEIMKVLEYDYTEMIPDLRVLAAKKKRDWDFHDPDVIRALFIENETNAFSKWRVEHLKVEMSNYPKPDIPTNRSYNLRMYSLRKKRAKVEKENRFLDKISDFNREIPRFDGQIRSNMTEELRRDFIRNKPSIPSHYMDHYAKYGKPPFKSHKIYKCREN